jgi:hypothetical protein
MKFRRLPSIKWIGYKQVHKKNEVGLGRILSCRSTWRALLSTIIHLSAVSISRCLHCVFFNEAHCMSRKKHSERRRGFGHGRFHVATGYSRSMNTLSHPRRARARR